MQLFKFLAGLVVAQKAFDVLLITWVRKQNFVMKVLPQLYCVFSSWIKTLLSYDQENTAVVSCQVTASKALSFLFTAPMRSSSIRIPGLFVGGNNDCMSSGIPILNSIPFSLRTSNIGWCTEL